MIPTTASTKRRRCLSVLVTVPAAVCASGCALPAARMDTAEASRRYETAYRLADTEFDSAEFWKPRTASQHSVEADLAPLIVQQVLDDGAERADSRRFGAVYLDGAGNARVDTAHPTVYTATSATVIHGVEHEQVQYVWCYPPESIDHPGGTIRCRGVRMTLDAEGFPLVWEVINRLQPPTDAAVRGGDLHVLFVSAAFERRAVDAFGRPPPGRRYSSERSVRHTPDTVVARVVEDGPVPMGPYVYLSAVARTVTTVLCRCSPSQVRRFVETGYYELRPLEELAAVLSKSYGSFEPRRARTSAMSLEQHARPADVLRWPRS